MVSEPFFYDQLTASQLVVNSAGGNAFNPNASVQVLLDSTQAGSYRFSFPPSLPSSRQPLFVAADGTSSTGFPSTLNLINALLSGSLTAGSVSSSTISISSTTTNGVSATLLTAPSQSTSYSLYLPPLLPSGNSQPIYLNSSGQMTTGFPATVNLSNLTATGNVNASSVVATQSLTSTSIYLQQTAGSTNPNIQLTTSSGQTASYVLTLPTQLPTANAPLYSSNAGVLMFGYPDTVNMKALTLTAALSGVTASLSTSINSPSVIIPVTSASTTTVTLNANSNQSSSYRLTFPVQLPASSNQPLFVDSTGQITTGFPNSIIVPSSVTTSSLQLTSSGGSVLSLGASGTQSSNYTITFPASLPSTSQPLYIDTNGSISTGYPTTVSLTNLNASGTLTANSASVSTLNLPISSGSSIVASLKANANTSTSYSLTLPLSLPSTSQPLFVDSNGNLTTGFPTTVNLTNISATGSVTAASASVSALNLPITSGSSIAASLKANANTVTSYSLTLPSSLPSTNQPLFVDASGNLTTGFPSTVTFTNANVTGSLTSALLTFPSASTNPATGISLKAPSGVSTSYTLTLPSTLPTSSQALLSDTSGNLSWGTVASGGGAGSGTTTQQTAFTSFSANSPQSTAASITGLQFTQVGVLQVYVNVAATANLGAVYMLTAYQVNGQWNLSYSYETSDDTDTGIDFQINSSSGQVTYTSPSFAGWTSTTFTWPSLTNTTTSGSLSVNYPTLKLAAGSNSNSSNITVPSNGAVIFPNVLYDTVGMYSTATGNVTIKVAGIYLIQAQLYLSNASTGGLTVMINNVVESRLWQENNTADIQWHGSQLISVKQGDVVALNASSGIVIYGMDAITSTWSLTMVAPVASSGILLGQNPVAGNPSATQGAFLSIGGPTFTDTRTAASGSAAGFASTYIAAPTIAATNTNVTTTSASTFVIAGPPVAGSNETLTNAYSVNVLGGPSRFAGPVMANSLSIPASGQIASFSASTSSNTGGNLTFTVPSGFSWLTSPGSTQNIGLAAGQYIVYISGGGQVNSNGAPSGAYGDIGISQNGAGLIINRINLGGFGGNYYTYQNVSYPVTSNGSSASSVTAYCIVGQTTYNTTTQTYAVVVTKLG